MPDDEVSERDPTPVLLWVYRRKGCVDAAELICRPYPSLYGNDKIVMYVFNGAWEMTIAEDGSLSAKHEPETVFEFQGFVWGYFDNFARTNLDTSDARRRFLEGERADPTMCTCCLGTGKIVPNELITRTSRVDGAAA
jgi:hypothetical protein